MGKPLRKPKVVAPDSKLESTPAITIDAKMTSLATTARAILANLSAGKLDTDVALEELFALFDVEPMKIAVTKSTKLSVSERRRTGWVGPDFFKSSAETDAVFGVVHNSPRMVEGIPAPGETYVEVREARHP